MDGPLIMACIAAGLALGCVAGFFLGGWLRHMMFLAGLITGLVIAAFAVMAFAYSFAREWAE